MNTNNDFKALWNMQEAFIIPDANEIFEKASQLKNKARKKLWLLNILLALTVMFILVMALYFHPQMITTKIGIALIIISIGTYLIAANKNIRVLFKGNIEKRVFEYLQQLIQLKKKQKFLQTTMLSIYFILLSLGIFIYLIEYAQMMSREAGFITYGLTAGWIAFNWFYIRPRIIKKQESEINEIINKLEEINKQLKTTE